MKLAKIPFNPAHAALLAIHYIEIGDLRDLSYWDWKDNPIRVEQRVRDGISRSCSLCCKIRRKP